jgi:2-polyprenyl-6-methoxyphenol hydroxylase-like FAD-dependent oxidoreductase
MSTNSTIAGTTRSGLTISASCVQPRVGQLDHADVGLDGAERVVLGGDAGLGQGVEEGGLADVGQAHDAALRLMDALADTAVTPVQTMRVCGDAPGGAIHFDADAMQMPALAWIVDAVELDNALRTAARFAPHLRAGSTSGRAALTVLAEGKDSRSREALGVPFHRRDYQQTALATRLLADGPHMGLARQWFRSPDVLALLPLDRPEPGRSLALVWSLPTPRAQELLQLPDAEFERELAQACGAAEGSLKLAASRCAWPLALGRAERLCGPGWVLVGDAAHQVHPLAGQGLNLGLADVVTLARVLCEREAWRGLGMLACCTVTCANVPQPPRPWPDSPTRCCTCSRHRRPGYGNSATAD